MLSKNRIHDFIFVINKREGNINYDKNASIIYKEKYNNFLF